MLWDCWLFVVVVVCMCMCITVYVCVLGFGVLARLWLVVAAWVVLFDNMFVCVCCASGNWMGAEGGAAVADAMKSCTQLTTLDLAGMCCGIACCDFVVVCVCWALGSWYSSGLWWLRVWCCLTACSRVCCVLCIR